MRGSNVGRLYQELKAINREQPFVYELYSGDDKSEFARFLEGERDESILLRYDSIQKEKYGDLTVFCIQEIFSIFKVEAPNFSSTLFRLGKGVGKLGLFAGGLFASGGISLGLSVIGAAISTGEALMKNEEKEEYESFIIHALKQYKNEKESIKNVETFILSSIKLLYLISQNRNICLVIDDPKILTLLDIQILKTYYNLFKDAQSKTRLSSEMKGVYRSNSGEIKSSLLTIFNWVDDHPDQLSIMTEELYSLRLFRWFLKRYRLVDDLHGELLPQVVKEDAFVGRGDYLDVLEEDAKVLLSNQRLIFRKIEANSGVGKTSLANKFVQLLLTKHSHENFVILQNAFSGERTGIAEGLTEIRKALDILRAKVDVHFKEEIMERVKQISETKAFRKGAEWFDSFSKLHSFVTPALSLAKLSIQEFDNLIGVIGSLNDAKEILETGKSLEDLDINTQKEGVTKTADFIILELIQELWRLATLSKEQNISIIWVIDDIQWMDEMSALFFHNLLQDEDLKGYPIYLIFLNRPADSISRVQNTKISQNLLLLHELLKEDLLDLKGFSLEDVRYLISESIVGNKDQHSIATSTIWDWFQQDDKTDVEPIYVTECLNLIADKQEDSLILQYNRFNDCWQWRIEDVNLLAIEISKKLQQWTIEHKSERSSKEKYSPCIVAIMEERVSRLKDFFEPNGDYLVDLIEAGSFVGEPFIISTIDRYIKENGKCYEIERHELDDVESFFQLIKKYWNYIPNSEVPAYIFSHALYREYLSHKHFSISGLEITILHQHAFRAIYETLEYDENNQITEGFRRILLVNAMYHGIHSGNFDGQHICLEYMDELCTILWNDSNYIACLEIASEALELSDRANGKQHDDSIRWLNRMATFYIQLGQYYNALKHCLDTLGRISNNSEDFYPDPEIVVEASILCGQSCRNLGRYDEAVNAYNIGIKFLELLEEEHPFRSMIYHDLANAYKHGNHFDEAEEIFKEVITIMEKKPQSYENSYSLASAYHNFGHLYFIKGDSSDKADFYYQKSLRKVKQDHLGNSSLHIRVLNNAAVLDIELGKYKSALGLLETSREITLNLFDEEHILYAEILTHFATINYKYNKDYQLAKNEYQEAIKIFKMNYSEQHPDVASAYKKLGLMYIQKGGNSIFKGVNWIKRSTKIYEDLYGNNDINTILGYEVILIYSNCYHIKIDDKLVSRILNSTHIKVVPTLILVLMSFYTDIEVAKKVENHIRQIVRNQDRKLVRKEVINVFKQVGLNDEFIMRAENVIRRVI
jgi:tetratricopeptide (TPR) repeat protein